MKSLTTYKFAQDNNIFFSVFGLIYFLTFTCQDTMVKLIPLCKDKFRLA